MHRHWPTLDDIKTTLWAAQAAQAMKSDPDQINPVKSPADACSVKPGLVDSRYSPVLLIRDVAQHHGLAAAMDGIAEGSCVPREVVLVQALAGSRGLLQLVHCHGCKAGQQALALLVQLARLHVCDAPAHHPHIDSISLLLLL